MIKNCYYCDREFVQNDLPICTCCKDEIVLKYKSSHPEKVIAENENYDKQSNIKRKWKNNKEEL